MKGIKKGRLLSAPKISKKKQIVLDDEALQILGVEIGDRVALRERNGEILITNSMDKAV